MANPPTLSFELFPPRRPSIAETVWQRVLSLAATGPDFFSVTYGASGSSREASADLVRRLLAGTEVPTVAHLTCVGATRAELTDRVHRLLDLGVRSFLALRGDPPERQTEWRPYPGGLARASELVSLIRTVVPPDVGVAVATYPAGRARDRRAEVRALKEKEAAGADLAITQVFYEPADYITLVSDARAAGVTMPILPGIMPMTDPARLRRLTELTGVDVPAPLQACLAVEDDSVRLRRGLAATLRLVDAVLAAGAPGVHLYTFNQDRPALDVVAQLRTGGLLGAAERPSCTGQPAPDRATTAALVP